MSHEEALRAIHLQVRTRGFSVQAVDGRPGWAYTVGLTGYGHPELVVVALEPEAAAQVLGVFARRVIGGDRLEPGVVEQFGDLFGVVPVHASRLAAGLCAVWREYRAAYGLEGKLLAVQLQPPKSWYCACCNSRQIRLDKPGGIPGDLPNREARRRATRHTPAKRR